MIYLIMYDIMIPIYFSLYIYKPTPPPARVFFDLQINMYISVKRISQPVLHSTQSI